MLRRLKKIYSRILRGSETEISMKKQLEGISVSLQENKNHLAKIEKKLSAVYTKLNRFPDQIKIMNENNNLNKKTNEILEKIYNLLGKSKANYSTMIDIQRQISESNSSIRDYVNRTREGTFDDPRTPLSLFWRMCEKSQETTLSFIKANMPEAICILNHKAFLQKAVSERKLTGSVLEFGVYKGNTINMIAEMVGPDEKVYGFDSFEGLPADWSGYKSFNFSNNGDLPEVKDNVTLIKGWFIDSLPGFIESESIENISMIHVDCDLYESAKTIFNYLEEYIRPGIILVFDEFFNYPNYEEHEFKVFFEFIRKHNYSAEYISYCGERVTIRVTK